MKGNWMRAPYVIAIRPKRFHADEVLAADHSGEAAWATRRQVSTLGS